MVSSAGTVPLYALVLLSVSKVLYELGVYANAQSGIGKASQTGGCSITFPGSRSDQGNGLARNLNTSQGNSLCSDDPRQILPITVFNVEVLIGCLDEGRVGGIVWAEITRGLCSLFASVEVDTFEPCLNYPLHNGRVSNSYLSLH